MEYRPAVPSDLAEIQRIEHLVFSDPWSAASFAPEFSDPFTFFRVAATETGLAGYVIARIVARQGEIANIAVDPAFQGQGLGGRLLDAAIAAADADPCEAVWLEVRESNVPAKRLYVSRGFIDVGRRRSYYRAPVEDAVVMRREPKLRSLSAEK